MARLPLSPTMKEFLKSADISQSYERVSSGTFFYGSRRTVYAGTPWPTRWDHYILKVRMPRGITIVRWQIRAKLITTHKYVIIYAD